MSGHGRSGDGGAARNEGNAMECGEMSHVPYQAPCGVGGEDIPTLFGNAERALAHRERGSANRGRVPFANGRFGPDCRTGPACATGGSFGTAWPDGQALHVMHEARQPRVSTDESPPRQIRRLHPHCRAARMSWPASGDGRSSARHSAAHQAGVPYADSLAVRGLARAVAGVPAGVGAGTDGAAVNRAPAWPTSDGGRSATGRSATRTHTYSARARPCHRRT